MKDLYFNVCTARFSVFVSGVNVNILLVNLEE